jgi:PucR C-terminal helix-turn-helix domain
MARTAETQRIEFLRRLLAEGAGTPDMNMRAGSFGLAAGARYRAFRGRPHDGGSASSVLQEILRWARGHGLEPLGAVVDGDAVGVLADGKFLPDGPTVGIGPPAELHRVNESFLIAGQLMEVGEQFGQRGPHTVESISLALAVATEHTVGDALVERILRPLLDQGSYGQELIASLDAFLSADMNTARAASLLVVHPNTLRYRMNQVKELSGLELHSAREISEVWWALRRYEWTTKTGYSS